MRGTPFGCARTSGAGQARRTATNGLPARGGSEAILCESSRAIMSDVFHSPLELMKMASWSTSPALGRRLPRIAVPPPGPESQRLAAGLARRESPAVSTICTGSIPIVWTRAQGANVVDADGNVYVDLTGGFGVASLGHTNRRVVAAATKQASRLVHALGDVHPSDARVALACRLAEMAPGRENKVILCNMGAEAVEVALKTATLFTGRTGFIAFRGGFHGQTYGALAVTSREQFRQPFGKQVFQGVAWAPYPYCYRCPLGLGCPECGVACLKAVEELLDRPPANVGPVAAIIVEPIQGREGEIVPPPEFLPRLKDLCARRGALLILDEMITGFSRTGARFASSHAGVEPDLLCVGKALANGFPIAACIGRAEVMDTWRYASGEAPYSSTFMGNPVSCAAAMAALQEHERLGLAGRAATLGAHALRRLREIQARRPLVGDVRGLGMMIGVELVTDRATRQPAAAQTGAVIRAALERGVILLSGGPHGNILSLTPPLVITRPQLDHALEVLDACLGLAGA